MKPSVCRIVQYVISAEDARVINARRDHYKAFCRSLTEQPEPGQPGMNGHIAHVGNAVREGDMCAALVVRVFDPSTANLQVHLDGNDTYWATSRASAHPGTDARSFPCAPRGQRIGAVAVEVLSPSY